MKTVLEYLERAPRSLRARPLRLRPIPQRVGPTQPPDRPAGLRRVAHRALPNARPRDRALPHAGPPGRAGAARPASPGKRRPHFVVYGHYDVQPPEPFDLWKSPPFEPRIAGRSLFARGASDNKGQHLAHLNAVEAYLQTGTRPALRPHLRDRRRGGGRQPQSRGLPPGSPERAAVRRRGGLRHRHARARHCRPSPTPCAASSPSRSSCTGPDRDLHSGIFGGTVDNPAMALEPVARPTARPARAG